MRRVLPLLVYFFMASVCFGSGNWSNYTLKFVDSQGIVYGLNYGDVTADVIGVDPEVDIVNADIVPHLWYSDGTRVDVISIKEEAFFGQYCKNLVSVKIPDTVKTVEYDAFFGCSNLRRVEVGKGIESLSGSALGYGCGGEYSTKVKVYWKGATPPESGGSFSLGAVNYVPNNSYLYRYSWKDAYVYDRIDDRFEVDGLIYIPYDDDSCDLVDCSYSTSCQDVKISNVVFHEGKCYNVRNLREGACYGNKALKNVRVDFNGDIPGSMFRDCEGIESLELKNCGEVGSIAFYGCRLLKNVIIHESVSYLDEKVFPSSVRTLTNYSTIPTKLDPNALSLVDKDYCILHIPQGSLERYRKADYWKDFKNIVEDGIPSVIEDVSALEENEGNVIVGYYDQLGHRYNEPQIGVNIVVYSDGTTKKIINK